MIKNKLKFIFLILFFVWSKEIFAQKGDHHFSLFGGQSNYLIERPIGQSSFIFNKVGLGYGYGIGKKINLFVNGEVGALSYSKVLLTIQEGRMFDHFVNWSFPCNLIQLP